MSKPKKRAGAKPQPPARPWLERARGGLAQYLPTAILSWLAIAAYHYSPYYADFLLPETKKLIIGLAAGYTLLALPYYILIPPHKRPVSRGGQIWSALKKVYGQSRGYLKNFTSIPAMPKWRLSKQEKVAVLFALVKFFFLPLMINFAFNNYHSLVHSTNILTTSSDLFTAEVFNSLIFPITLSLLLLIDTTIFAFGYMFESRLLNNKVRSVEPTILGWTVALISYPPFNGTFGNYIGSYASDHPTFGTPTQTAAAGIVVLMLMTVYVWATIALGAKSSNLTNRGIVGRGPYRFVRHPAYISKNLAWWIAIIPIFSLAAVVSMFIWSFIYFLRALTEERHLFKDPDYQAYCQKVRYRFIPKLI